MKLLGQQTANEDAASKQYVDSVCLRPVRIDIETLYSLETNSYSVSDSDIAATGLTSEVISNMANGLYTKVVEVATSFVGTWDYEASISTSEKTVILRRGDMRDSGTIFSLYRNNRGLWAVQLYEI